MASKADLIFKLKGKERLRGGIDYNIDGTQEGKQNLLCLLLLYGNFCTWGGHSTHN